MSIYAASQFKWLVACAAIAACAGVAAPAQAQMMALSGTWKLNHDKSQGPMAAVEILTINVTPEEEHYVIHEQSKDGKKHDGEYRAKFDGKEYENKNFSSGRVGYVSLKQVFARVEEVTNIRHEPGANGAQDSKVTSYYLRQMLPDGKTLYDTLIDPQGQITAFRVFDKVSSKTSGP